MLSSMLEKIEKEENNVVRGYNRPQVTSYSDRTKKSRINNGTRVKFCTAFPAAAYAADVFPGAPPRYSSTLQLPVWSKFPPNKDTCFKGPKTVASSYNRSYRERVSVFSMDMPFMNHGRPSHKVMTPAYTPKYSPAVSSHHRHTASTPAYTPKYSNNIAIGPSGSSTLHKMKKSVMYTPKYDPMYFVGANDGCADGSGAGPADAVFLASPTTPKYTPTSPAFLELVSHHAGTCTLVD
jgi:hypothetical protein